MSIRKVEPIAGAMWVVNGIKLWWRDLRGLGLLGLLLGVIGIVPQMVIGAGAGVAAVVQLFGLLVSALMVLALFYAAREVDQGRSATPAQLAHVLQSGKVGQHLAGVLLPQLLAVAVVMLLLGWIIGFEEFERLAQSLQTLQQTIQTDPNAVTPEALMGLPIGRLILWLGLALGVVVAIGLLTFTLLPDMLFGDADFGTALQRSVRVCLANLPAMIVFTFAMLFLSACILGGMGPISLVLMAVLGPVGASLAINALIVAVLIPISINAMYLGWKQLFGAEDGNHVSPPADRVAM